MSSKKRPRPESRWVSVVIVVLVGWAVVPALAAPEFSWVPVDASAPFETAMPDGVGRDTEIFFATGSSGLIVEFEVRINGWGSAPGNPTLGTAQAFLDESSLFGANADPPQPGVDLSLLNNQVWVGNVTPHNNSGANGWNDGLFTLTNTCHHLGVNNTDIPCASIPAMTWNPCPQGAFYLCLRYPDWPFSYVLSTVATSTWGLGWAGLTNAGQCIADAGGTSAYLGTLVLNVPDGFEGKYTLDFDTTPSMTFINGCSGSVIPGMTLTTGSISIGGACCMPGGSCTPRTGADCGMPGVNPVPGNCAADTDGDGVADPCDPCPYGNPDGSCADPNLCLIFENIPPVIPIFTLEPGPSVEGILVADDWEFEPGGFSRDLVSYGVMTNALASSFTVTTSLWPHGLVCTGGADDGGECDTDADCLPDGSCDDRGFTPGRCNVSGAVCLDNAGCPAGESCIGRRRPGHTGIAGTQCIFTGVPSGYSALLECVPNPGVTLPLDGVWAVMGFSDTDDNLVTFAFAGQEPRIGASTDFYAWDSGSNGASWTRGSLGGGNFANFVGRLCTIPVGACCMPGVSMGSSCTYETEEDCTGSGGIFLGYNNAVEQRDCGLDSDGDGTADVCDPCPLSFGGDVDGDGICDGIDNCPDHANPGQENCHGSGLGDACSIALGLSLDCPAGPGNGVPDECEGDCDGDGEVDSCTIARCTGDPACSDCQRASQPGHGVPDWCDLNVSLVSVDNDANGVPDECDFGPPLPAPYPSNRKKVRYITFDTNKTANDDRNVAFRVELKQLSLGSCDGNGAMCREDRGGDDCRVCCPVGGGPCTTKPCLAKQIDCNPTAQTCEPTGEVCINDFTLDNDPVVGQQSAGRSWWLGPVVETRCSISYRACTPGGLPCGRCFDPNSGTLTSVGCLTELPCDPGQTCVPQPNETCASVHRLVDESERLVSTDWAELVDVGDCEIVPVARYGVTAVDVDFSNVSEELIIETIDRPIGSNSYWADAVGRIDDYCAGTWTPCGHDYGPCVSGDCVRDNPGNPVPDTAFCDGARCIDPACSPGAACAKQWGPPNGVVNFDDINALLFSFEQPRGAVLPYITWVDVQGAGIGPLGTYPPDFVPNHADSQFIRLAFEGRPYPFVDPGDCP